MTDGYHLITGNGPNLPGVHGALKKHPKPAAKKRSRLKKSEYLARFLDTPKVPIAETLYLCGVIAGPFVYAMRLPLAPTVNNYYMTIPGRGLRTKSAECTAYFEAVDAMWKKLWNDTPPLPLTARLEIICVCHMARNGESDLSNRWKALEDAMVACGVLGDDSQIDRHTMIRGGVVPHTGAMDVVVRLLETKEPTP